jgi:diguanylate cyclase (GGDEF)-like protein
VNRVVPVAIVALAAGLVPPLAGWLHPFRPIEFGLLIVLAALVAGVTRRNWDDTSAVSPVVILDLVALTLFSAPAAAAVAAVRSAAENVFGATGAVAIPTAILRTATAIAAALAAGFAFAGIGGAAGQIAWPWHAAFIAVTTLAYCVIGTLGGEIVTPLLTRRTINPAFMQVLLHSAAPQVIAACAAVGVAELVQRQLWPVLALAAVPLVFLYLAYCAFHDRLEYDRRRREVIDALDEGMCSVGHDGSITFWNETMERLLECPRERALGCSPALAVGALAKTEIPKAIEEAAASRTARTLAQVPIVLTSGSKTVQVKIVPTSSGVTVVVQDVTAHSSAAQALRRNEDRLSLAAAGASDGLWEWDLKRQELYVSGRWRAMLGLPDTSMVGSPNEWLARVHPDDVAALKEALEAHLARKTERLHHQHRLRHEDGSYRTVVCRGVAAAGTSPRSLRIGGSLSEVTESAAAPERPPSAGFVDALTGLCNRGVFVEGLGRRLEESRQNGRGGRFAVLYLDLDRFKVVNDSLGHLVGDELLIAVSRRLESCLRPGDTLARLGGDEFAILLSGLADDQQANAIAFRIQETLSAPFNIAGREVFTSASIGIAFGLAQYSNPDDIMRDADTAMYHAKSRGKARHELFDADMHARVRDRLGLESDLRHAVNGNDFEVHYQPIVSLSSGMCVGFESLVRWTRNGEPVSPATFIPMAEELGLIESLGTWVLQEACRTFAEWKRRFPDSRLDCITVNVSSRQLMQHNFMRIVEQAVLKSDLRPCDLRIEITETALMESPAVAAELLRELRDFGVKIYLDDFGTGYSSLSHLHKLPVDALKIDRSFVKSLMMPDRPAIVESVLALARTLNTSVVAEGIETDVQARELERLGCTHAQGFLFSKALSRERAEEMLIANQPLGPKRVAEEAAAAKPVSSAGFEWPAHVHVRSKADSTPAAALGTLAATARH